MKTEPGPLAKKKNSLSEIAEQIFPGVPLEQVKAFCKLYDARKTDSGISHCAICGRALTSKDMAGVTAHHYLFTCSLHHSYSGAYNVTLARTRAGVREQHSDLGKFIWEGLF